MYLNSGKLIALSSSAELCDLIVGQVTESADIRGLAARHKADIAAFQRAGASPMTISQTLYEQLLAAGTQTHSFAVESIYVTNQDAEYNAKVWAEASRIDSTTISQLRKVTRATVVRTYTAHAIDCRFAGSGSSRSIVKEV